MNMGQPGPARQIWLDILLTFSSILHAPIDAAVNQELISWLIMAGYQPTVSAVRGSMILGSPSVTVLHMTSAV
jgi:hypothetical protein